MSVVIGLAELLLAGLIFHRIVPIVCDESRWSAVKVWADATHKYARIMFGYSIFYLFALFAVMMLDKV